MARSELSILLESYCNEEKTWKSYRELNTFNSPRVLLQQGGIFLDWVYKGIKTFESYKPFHKGGLKTPTKSLEFKRFNKNNNQSKLA